MAPVGNAPVATINHPGDGEIRNVNEDIPFVGVGTDVEDGALTGAALVWTSSLEGELGTGTMFDLALTQAGMHVITLTVTDSDGNQGTDTVTLDMQ
jgi:chitinase